MTQIRNEKILLALLPFWDPQIPPLGISCLKSHLQRHQFNVKTVDVNVEDGFKDIQNLYFDTLKEHIPDDKIGNYYKIAHDVLANHMMAHLNYKNKSRYLESVKLLIYKTFYAQVDNGLILDLSEILSGFYAKLEKYFSHLLESEKPSMLGLSVFEGTLPASLFAFQLAKKYAPQITTVMGGAVFTDLLNIDSPDFKYFLEQTPYIDKIFIGEGEHLFLKYLQNGLPDSQRVYQLEDIDHKMLDISSADIPDFSDLDLRFYPYLSAYNSRSCPFNCSFCSEKALWGKYRKKDSKRIVEELKKLHQKHHSQLFLFADSLINPIINDLSEEIIKSGISLYWDAFLRADKHVCNTKNTMYWRRAGFYRARLGVESGSQRVLELMGKKITPNQMKEALACLAYAGIKTTTYWVVGYPGETEADFLETLKFLEELKDDVYEADCTPFRYYLSGQSATGDWAKKNKDIPLYGEETRDLLMIRAWILDVEPSREETRKRMNRFVEHCTKLGIPNPYSLKDTYKADERWKRIQKNATPSLVEFSKGTHICENLEVKRLVFAKEKSKQSDAIDFGF